MEFFVFVTFFLQKMYSSKFTPTDSGWDAGPHPESMEVNLLKPFLLSYKFNKYKKIQLNSGVQGMSNQ